MGKATKAEEEAQEAERENEPAGEAADALAEVATSGRRQPETRIHRVNDEGDEEFIFRAPPALVDEAYLQRKFGPGKYVMFTYACVGPRGKFQYVKDSRRTISVGAVPKDENAPPPAPPRQDGDDDSRLMFKTQMLEMMKDQAESRNNANLMMMNMMKMMADSAATQMQAMTAVIQAIGNRPPDTGNKEILAALIGVLGNKKDPVEIATAIAALAKQNTPAIAGLDSLDTILDLADRISRRQNGEDVSLMSVVKESLPEVLSIGKDIVAKMPSRGAAPIPGPRPPITRVTDTRAIAAPPGPAAPPPETTPAVPQDEWSAFEPQVDQLVSFAQNDHHPADVAAMAMVAIPGPGKAQLREWLAQTDDKGDFTFEGALSKRFPQIATYPSWLGALCMELRVRFGIVDEDELPPGDGEGDEPADEPKKEGKK